MGFFRGFVGKENDAGEDEGKEHTRRGVPAEGQASLRDGFVEEVSDDSAQRAGENEGRPEQLGVRNLRPKIGGRNQSQEYAEEECAAGVAQPCRVSGPVAESCT